MSTTDIVHIRRLEDVSGWTKRQLRQLNEGRYGRMRRNLDEYGSEISPTINAKVFYIIKHGIVVSWGMVYNPRLQRYRRRVRENRHGYYLAYINNGWYVGQSHITDLYTHERHRGKGYGSTIAAAIQKEYSGKILRGIQTMTSVFKRHGFRDDLTIPDL